MLMLSLRWRALRLICQNTFHTLLLKLCPLLFPAFKLKQSPVCQRHAGRAASRPCRAAGAAERGVKRCPSERSLHAGSWAERGTAGVRMDTPCCLGFVSGSWITESLEARRFNTAPVTAHINLSSKHVAI